MAWPGGLHAGRSLLRGDSGARCPVFATAPPIRVTAPSRPRKAKKGARKVASPLSSPQPARQRVHVGRDSEDRPNGRSGQEGSTGDN